MRKGILLTAVVLCLLMSGCSWMDGSYLSITPHQTQSSGAQTRDISASNYLQLRDALEETVRSGVESAVINVAQYRQDLVEEGIANAVSFTADRYPLGAYAVDQITYEIGTAAGKPAISVDISYIHGRSEMRKIKEADNMDAVKAIMTDALSTCSDSVVIWVTDYRTVDFVQFIEDYMKENPDIVMEMPQVAVGIYPEIGNDRILEVKFTYETSRESLRQMQKQVQRVFESASLYVNSDAADYQKFDQLYTFLMERFDYEVNTSITPSYSLLSHGVGDAEAFAMVYAAMCRHAGLDCRVVSGTRDGQSHHWNIIFEDGLYYHVDLLKCSEIGQFRRFSDADMQDYVWDYSAYGNASIETDVTGQIETEKNN